MSTENGNDKSLEKKAPVVPIRRLRDHILSVCREGRAKDILDYPRLDEEFPKLPVQDAYFAVQELGLHDATELLAVASPEQVRAFTDLDIWHKDVIDARKFLEWTDVLLELEPERMARHVRALDQESLVVLIARSAKIADLTMEEELPPDIVAGPWRTPDNFYALYCLDEDKVEDFNRIVRFLDRLYLADFELAHSLVKAAKWEPTPELEELAYRWRSGRLADYGYADYYEALEVYTYLKPSSVRIGENTKNPLPPDEPEAELTGTDLVLAETAEEHRDFLDQCLKRIEDPQERRAIAHAAASIANKMMAADLVEDPDFETVAQYMASIRRYLSLGLEYLTKGDPSRGPEALRTVALMRIFRVGFSITLDLKRLVAQLRRAGRISLAPSGATLLDEPWEALVRGLEERKPVLTRAFDTPPGEGYRPFETMADVRFALELIEDLSEQWPLCFEKLGFDLAILSPEGLKGCLPSDPAAVTLGDLFRTALLNHLLDGGLVVRPLDDQRLQEAKRALAAQRRKGPILRYAVKAVERTLSSRSQEPPKRLERILETWCGPLQARNIEQLAAVVITTGE